MYVWILALSLIALSLPFQDETLDGITGQDKNYVKKEEKEQKETVYQRMYCNDFIYNSEIRIVLITYIEPNLYKAGRT